VLLALCLSWFIGLTRFWDNGEALWVLVIVNVMFPIIGAQEVTDMYGMHQPEAVMLPASCSLMLSYGSLGSCKWGSCKREVIGSLFVVRAQY
jgi:hypothetical protein